MELQWVPLPQAVQRVFSGDIINSIAVVGILGVSQCLVAGGEEILRSADAEWDSRAWRFAQRRDS